MVQYLRLFLFVNLMLTVGLVNAAIKYVKPIAAGTGDGSSWSNASNDIQLMINQSTAGDEIWVTAGTYRPIRRMDNLGTISTGNRQNAFVMKSGIKVYGGFVGTESLLSQRNLKISSNASVLSGDLSNNDGANFTNMSENSYHLVVFAGLTGNTVFDGFTIKSVYYKEGTDPYEMPTVNGHEIHNHFGGAIYVVECAPIISNLIVTQNLLHLGSGLYSHGNSLSTTVTSPKIVNCVFHGNKGYFGAAILNYQSKPEFYNNLMYDNEVLYNGALSSGLRGGDGGAIYNWSANPTFVNCTVVNNKAFARGGGFFHNGGSVTKNNCIVYGNTQGNTPSITWEPQVFRSGGTVTLNNNIFQNWTGSGTNINASGVAITDIFINPTANDYHLKQTAVTINKGGNSYISSYVTDIEGRVRLVGANVDMGAFEFSKLKEWDGGASSTNWADANNWIPNGVPISGDSVILNNNFVSGSYDVNLPNSSVVIQSLEINPTVVGSNINFNIPSSNTIAPNLQLTGSGFNSLKINDRGRINNNHGGATNTNAILIDNITSFGMQLNSGSYYYHGANSSDIGVLLNLDAKTNSTFEYDKTVDNNIMIFPLLSTVSQVKFYHLIISGSKKIAGTKYGLTLAKNWDLFIDGDLTIRNKAALGIVRGANDQPNRKIVIKGNIKVENTTNVTWVDLTGFPLVLGWDVEFAGVTNQEIIGNVSFLSKVTVNNPNGIDVKNIFQIKSADNFGLWAPGVPSLVFVNGLINTIGSALIDIQVDGENVLSGYNENRYINGKLKRIVSTGNSYDFPVGKNGNFQLATVNFGAFSGTNTLSVEFLSSGLGSFLNRLMDGGIEFDNVLDAGFWRISPDIPLLGTYSIALHQRGFSNAEYYHRVVKRSNDLSEWAFEGTHVSNSMITNLVSASRSGLNGFSDFAIAKNWVNPLPIELLSFEANCINESVNLVWSTASEFNSDYFEIQRSIDSEFFETIAKIKAAGNSSSLKSYSFIDNHELNKQFYYRLKQVDFDGQFEIFKIVSAQCNNTNVEFSLYPNPSSGKSNLNFNASEDMNCEIVIMSVDGRKIHHKTERFTKGINTIQIQIEGLEKGIYLVNLLFNNDMRVVKWKVE